MTVVSPTTAPIPLTRTALSLRRGEPTDTPPVRMVHMGLGAFHRAHQAWYTAAADDAGDWGIAAFTGRSAAAAHELASQDGLYTLIERSDTEDRMTIVPSIVAAADGADLDRFVQLLVARTTALVTLTITESGYRLTGDARPDLTDPVVVSDIAWLATAFGADHFPDSFAGGPRTALGRLLLGLEARYRAGGGPIAIVPCDNIPHNGAFVRSGVVALAEAVDAGAVSWIADNVSFVSTSVDRITPKTTPEDAQLVASDTGWLDKAVVVTEPFTDWVLSGDFPAGRPAWETAGARFVDDIAPFERRKLWLLNGAHSLLAYGGRLRGHETVASAIADPVCRNWVHDLWDEAAHRLTGPELDLPSYRRVLLERFENSRIEHRLAQIGIDGVTKLRLRIGPIAQAERAAGRDAVACARVIGAWIALLLQGHVLEDTRSADVRDALAGSDDETEPRLIALVNADLASDAEFVAAVRSSAMAFRFEYPTEKNLGDNPW